MSARVSVEDNGEYDSADDEYALPDTIWYLVGHREGRHLFVDHPSEHHGGVPVGIQMVYTKYLDSDEARSMAQALTEAADEWDRMKVARDAERQRRAEAVRHCEEDLGGHDWPAVEAAKAGLSLSAGDWKCRRCGSEPKTVAYSYAIGG